MQRINYKFHHPSKKLHDCKWRINSKPVSKKHKMLKKVFHGGILDSHLSIKYWYIIKLFIKTVDRWKIKKDAACLHCGCFRRQPCCYKLFIKTLRRLSVVFLLYGLILSLYWGHKLLKLHKSHENIITSLQWILNYFSEEIKAYIVPLQATFSKRDSCLISKRVTLLSLTLAASVVEMDKTGDTLLYYFKDLPS